MSRQATGWSFVGVQFALLIALAVLSARPGDAWPTPAPLLAISALCTLGGLVVIVVAALQLGRSLTATPVPNARNELSDTGLYGVVRHPIYSGVLLVVIGLALRSASWVTAAVAVVTIVFFSVKARWEERQLAERHPDYPAYCERVPRFVPRPARPSR
jgi:protein-S-isoprenylcysteine O-methyltransferase Ste14